MDINVVDNPSESRYGALADDGTLVGIAEYSRAGDVVTIEHVEVVAAYEGQGIASRLTTHVLDQLRGEGARIIPRCPYAVAFLRKHPEYADLVVPQE